MPKEKGQIGMTLHHIDRLISRLQNETVGNTLRGNENENEKRYLAAILLDNPQQSCCLPCSPDPDSPKAKSQKLRLLLGRRKLKIQNPALGEWVKQLVRIYLSD